MVAALMIVAVLAQTGGMRAGRAGGSGGAPRPAAAPENVTNPAGSTIEIVTHAILADGDKRETGRFTLDASRGKHEAFVYVPASVCDRAQISDVMPAQAAYGWKVSVTPTRRGIPQDVKAAVAVGWQRSWYNGVLGRSANGINVLQVGATKSHAATTLDQLSGNPRMWRILTARRAGAQGEGTLRGGGGSGGGQGQPKLLTPTATCSGVDMSIDARLLDGPGQPVMEAELWFVHNAPDGKETTQRQTVRMRDGGRGEFYFDDLSLTGNVYGRLEPITLEVFGKIQNMSLTSDDDMEMKLELTRRFINPKAAGLGIPPRVGRGEYPISISAGEVVSFVLPPLEDDRGSFLGHRFSVRMRISPVKEEPEAPAYRTFNRDGASTAPGRSAVCAPLRTTNMPFTSTCGMPSA
ncbi:MAG: hypothetical protein WD690_19165 [Vicinamibacterales bacterium]